MAKNKIKSKMTLDRLAGITAREFSVVGEKIDKIHENMATKGDLKELTQNIATNFATKGDLKHFSTKLDLDDLRYELKTDIQKGTVEVLQAVDKIATTFDKAEKDHAADKLLHDRHEKWLERIGTKVGVK